MSERGGIWRPSPGGLLRHPLPGAGPLTAALLRGTALTLGRGLAVEGAGRLAAAGDPAILALNHNNTVESLAVPAAVQIVRGGRPVSYLVDWMYLQIPVTGWLIGRCDPIPVWRKRARWGLWERRRREGAARRDPIAEALGRLAEGRSVGLFPEGTRNRRGDRLLRGRSGLGRLVLASTAPVLPLGIHYPAAERLGRVPRIGRAVVRVGEPLDFAAERAAWREAQGDAGGDLARLRRLERRLGRRAVERVMAELAALSGKNSTPAAATEREPARPRISPGAEPETPAPAAARAVLAAPDPTGSVTHRAGFRPSPTETRLIETRPTQTGAEA